MEHNEDIGKIKISLSRDSSAEAYRQTHFYLGSGKFSDLTKVITQRIWSPMVWRDGIRKKENFLSSAMIALDSDSGKWTLIMAREWVDKLGLAAIIGTTKSHGKAKGKEPACDRFRVLIPTTSACTNLDDFEYTMRLFIESMDCDISCKDGARFYFPCKEIFYARDGIGAEWAECPPDESAAGIAASQELFYEAKWRDISCTPARILLPLMHGCAVGKRHMTTYIIACFFCRTGWSEEECYGMFESFSSPLINEIGEKDVRRCISNAFKRIGPIKAPIAKILSFKGESTEGSQAQALQSPDSEGNDW